MPTNDQNGTTGSTPVSANPNAVNPQDISDLGDILMEKTLDATQNSDFVSVQPSDVNLLSTAADSVAEPNSTPEDIKPAEPSTVTSTTNESLDLGDISLEDLTKPIVTNPEQPVVNENQIDLNAIQSISIPESSPVTINPEPVMDQPQDINNTDTSTTITTPIEVAPPVPEASLESLGSGLSPEITTPEIPVETAASDSPPAVEPPQAETISVAEDAPIPESIPAPEVAPVIEHSEEIPTEAIEIPVAESESVVEVAPIVESVPETTTQEPDTIPTETATTPVVEGTQEEQVANNTPEIAASPQTTIEEKIAEVQAASQEIQ
jgi:hypothetical protein